MQSVQKITETFFHIYIHIYLYKSSSPGPFTLTVHLSLDYVHSPKGLMAPYGPLCRVRGTLSSEGAQVKVKEGLAEVVHSVLYSFTHLMFNS